MATSSARKSVILPLPSSPHWSPTITVAGIRPRARGHQKKAPELRDLVWKSPACVRRTFGGSPSCGRSDVSRDGRCALQARSLTSCFAGLAPLDRGGWSIAGRHGPNRVAGLTRCARTTVPTRRYLRTDCGARPGTVALIGDASHRSRGLAALVIAGILLAWMPGVLPAWVGADRARRGRRDRRRGDRRRRSARSSCSLVGWLRLGRLVRAAERIADGDYTIGGDGSAAAASKTRLARVINRIAESMADTHDRATIDRLTDVYNRQALAVRAVHRGRTRVAL